MTESSNDRKPVMRGFLRDMLADALARAVATILSVLTLGGIAVGALMWEYEIAFGTGVAAVMVAIVALCGLVFMVRTFFE